MKKISIHQPQYMPWVPYIDKILLSDEFVFLDNVQFQKNGLHNRNQIKGPQGPQWLTLPVHNHLGQPIYRTQLSDVNILKKHLKTLRMNYAKSPYFNDIYKIIYDVFNDSSYNLSVICCSLISNFLQYLEYEGKILKGTQVCAKGKNSDLVLNICKLCKADIYISGQGGKEYLRLDQFEKVGIKVQFQKFKYKVYRQNFPKPAFCSNLSIVDLLFNEGKNSREIIERGRL